MRVVGATSVGSWANLSELQSGQKIQLVQMNSKKDTGTFLNVTDAAITLQEKSGERTIKEQDVRIVKLLKNKHRLRNTLIGAGVGAGVGAGIGAATYSPCKPPPNSGFSTCFFDITRGNQAAIFGVIGLVGGAATGALWPSRPIIYSASGSGS